MNNLMIQIAIMAIGIAYAFLVLIPLFGFFAGALKAFYARKPETKKNLKHVEYPVPV